MRKRYTCNEEGNVTPYLKRSAGPSDSHPPDYVVPDGVLIQTEPPDDEHLLLETCRGVKIIINSFRKKSIKLVIN